MHLFFIGLMAMVTIAATSPPTLADYMVREVAASTSAVERQR